jgi:Ca2+-binding RTX toxin-like protein
MGTRGIARLGLSGIVTAALVGAVVLAPAASGARPKCGGKRATIVSNARTIVGSKRPDVIVAGGGKNTINGKGGNDRICGGGGNDTIDGSMGSDRLFGGGGKDDISGFTGRDTIDGGPGNDTIHGDTGTDDLDGGGGADRVFGEAGNERMTGGPGNGDFVDEGPGDSPLVSGGAGDFDIVLGGAGHDRVDGGPGAHDIASYATVTGAVTVNLGAGSVSGADSERLSGVEDALGGSSNDTLIGSGDPNRLDGGPGNDNLRAVGGGDHAFGGPGSDQCVGGFASENSCGNENVGNATGVDLVQSIDGSSNLVISGRNQADVLTVSRSGSRYTVQGQNRIAPISQGACQQQGQSRVTCSGRVTAVLASLGGGDDSLALQGVGANALIDGGPGTDTLRGGDGNDTLNAGEDRDPDTMFGGGGNDVIFAINVAHPQQSSGTGRMHGGGGSDLLIGSQPCDGNVFDGGAGKNDSASFARVGSVRATIGGAVVDRGGGGPNCTAGRISSSTEKIEGSTSPDVLTGDNGPNDLLGRGGNDVLNGKGGRDRCIGGGGVDRASNCESRSSIP